MKSSIYVKDGKVRLARYVRYDIRQPCANAAYPSRISLVQSCVDDLASLPVGLRVNISGLSGSCTTDIDYARTSGFLCDAVAGSTVLNPDCPPSGWSYEETESTPTELQATVSAVTLTLPDYVMDDFSPTFNCWRWYWSATSSGAYDLVIPLAQYSLGLRAPWSFSSFLPWGDGYLYFSFSVVVYCRGGVSAVIGLDLGGAPIAYYVGGSGLVAVDPDCTPNGTVIIPMYLGVGYDGIGDGSCSATCPWGGMGCADVSVAELPFYVGNLTINIARV